MTRDPTAQAEIDRAASAWLIRLGSPALDDAGRQAFRAWLDADPAHGRAFETARRVWDGLSAPATALAETERRRARRRSRRRAGLAATAVVGVALLVGAVLHDGADHATGYADRETVVLADGSRMTLDGNSAADVAVDGATRRVTLRRGRAFFEVTADPDRPFVVRAAGFETVVLGTAFAVDLQGTAVAVVVEHGSVAVRDAAGDAVELSAGEQVAARDRIGVPEPARLASALAWRRGLMVFEDRTLGEVVAELDRATGRRILVPQASVRSLRLSGVFREDDPETVLAAIAAALGVRVVGLGVATVLYR